MQGVPESEERARKSLCFFFSVMLANSLLPQFKIPRYRTKTLS